LFSHILSGGSAASISTRWFAFDFGHRRVLAAIGVHSVRTGLS
jgi:hypothetical protein